jgi:hypothetical protein
VSNVCQSRLYLIFDASAHSKPTSTLSTPPSCTHIQSFEAPPPSPQPQRCPVSPSTVTTTYPFTIHTSDSRHKPSYNLITVDGPTSTLHVRAWQCYGATLDGAPCTQCIDTGGSIDTIKHRATQPFTNRSRNTLSHAQLTSKLRAIQTQLKVRLHSFLRSFVNGQS